MTSLPAGIRDAEPCSLPSANPRVLIVVGQLAVGGTERHLAQILPILRGAGLDVRVFVFKHGGAIADYLESRGVPVIAHASRHTGWRGVLQVALVLVRVMRESRPDIVHFFLPAAYLVGTFVTWPMRVKRIMSRRSLANYQARYPGVRLLERMCHRTMDVVIANSQAVARELETEGVPRRKLRVIYNGVADRSHVFERANAREKLGMSHGTLVLVMIANLIPYKGHADLLEALALSRSRFPHEWIALLAGRDDGIGSDLRALAVRLGIDSHLRWLGAVDDVGPCLAASDIGVLASHEEGFSNAILEGMAAGLPMVVTDVGGNAEAVINGVCGLVVPPRDPVALAAALYALAGSHSMRARLGQAARERAAACFTVDACVAKYEQLYRDVAAGAPSASPTAAENECA